MYAIFAILPFLLIVFSIKNYQGGQKKLQKPQTNGSSENLVTKVEQPRKPNSLSVKNEKQPEKKAISVPALPSKVPVVSTLLNTYLFTIVKLTVFTFLGFSSTAYLINKIVLLLKLKDDQDYNEYLVISLFCTLLCFTIEEIIEVRNLSSEEKNTRQKEAQQSLWSVALANVRQMSQTFKVLSTGSIYLLALYLIKYFQHSPPQKKQARITWIILAIASSIFILILEYTLLIPPMRKVKKDKILFQISQVPLILRMIGAMIATLIFIAVEGALLYSINVMELKTDIYRLYCRWDTLSTLIAFLVYFARHRIGYLV